MLEKILNTRITYPIPVESYLELKEEIKCSCDKSKLSPLDIKLEPIEKDGNCIKFIRRVSCTRCGAIKQDLVFEYIKEDNNEKFKSDEW